tara:strand:+ start:527 stop:3904 length:3378 start_codon:yes stop_codon:yes gene_type:complete
MATYIKGHKNFYPEIKPFTPDYKFLTATLDARQNIYDSNWKAQNDLYNRVVYSDLTNPNSQEYQRQYTEKIGPQLELIAGMDLSLEQNVQQAKSVFAPFFSDDTVVYDMVWTGKFNDAIKKYNTLAGSSQESVRQKVDPDVSLQKLAIDKRKMENASRTEILDQPLPELVFDADLVRNAQKFLSELDPALTITQPVPNMVETGKLDKNGQPILKANNDFIITQTNGALVEGEAYMQIMNSLYNDPRVQKYYNAKSYVQANNFAMEALEAGRVSTENQGLELWAAETIGRIDALNAEIQGQAEYEARLANQININWQNYAQTHGIVPGSLDEEAANTAETQAQQIQLQLDRIFNQKQFSESPDPDPTALYNKASALLANYNMDQDMREAARQFSMRGMKIEQEVNEYSLNKYKSDLELRAISARHKSQMTLQEDKYKREKDLEVFKQNLANSLTAKLLDGTTSDYGESNAFFVDSEGQLQYKNDPIKIDQLQIKRDGIALDADMAAMIPDMVFNAGDRYLVDKQKGIYKIPAPHVDESGQKQEYYEGNLEEIQSFLNRKIQVDGVDTDAFENEEAIATIFGDAASYYKEDYNAHLQNPGISLTPDFQKIYNQLFTSGNKEQASGVYVRYNDYINNVKISEEDKANKVNKITSAMEIKNSEAVAANDPNNTDYLSKDEQDIRALYEVGFLPPIDQETGYMLSKDEYYNNMLTMLQNGDIDPASAPALYGFLNNTNFINDISAKKFGAALMLSESPVVYGDSEFLNKARETIVSEEIDEDKLSTVVDKIYDHYYKKVNELTSKTPSRTYFNNSRGINPSDPGSNIAFNAVTSVNTKLLPKAGSEEDKFVGVMLGQIYKSNAAVEGGNGWIGYTLADVDNIADMQPEGIDFRETENRAAKYIWDQIITERKSLGKNSKATFNASFFPTWGPEVIDDEDNTTQQPYAAYQFSSFDDDFEKMILRDNKNYPSGVEQADIKKILSNGFTYIFPRNQTIQSNPLRFTNTDRSATLQQRINRAEGGIYRLPSQHPSPWFPQGYSNADFQFTKVGQDYYMEGVLRTYRSDLSQFPNGFSEQIVPKTKIVSDLDMQLDNVLIAVDQQYARNYQKYTNESQIAKSNREGQLNTVENQ